MGLRSGPYGGRNTNQAPRCLRIAAAFSLLWLERLSRMTAIQPQGVGLSALWAAFACYSALRRLGLDIDIVPSSASFDGYALCVVPCLPIVPPALADALERFAGQIVIGPRSGSREADFAIPADLPRGLCKASFPARSCALKACVRASNIAARAGASRTGSSISKHPPRASSPRTTARSVACWRQGKVRYLAAWPTPELIAQVLERAAVDAGLDLHRLPEGLRIRRAGNRIHVFNCSAAAIDLPDSVKGYPVLGQRRLPAAGVTILETG